MLRQFPVCTIKAQNIGLSEWHWTSVIPFCIKEGENEYVIIDWMGLGQQCQMSNAEHVPDQIKKTITKIMKPLASLYFDKTTESWNYKTYCAGALPIDQQTIAQGFVSDMSSSRGRTMMFSVLSQLFSSETSVRVVNIGGGSSTVNEPSVRELVFELKDVDSDCSRVSKFIPDIVLESKSKEHLLVAIIKGPLLYQQPLSQLRYMLMPAAIKQGSAVGLLICTKEALLEKCILADNGVRFERNYFKLSEDSLVADMEILFSNIYSQVMTTI